MSTKPGDDEDGTGARKASQNHRAPIFEPSPDKRKEGLNPALCRACRDSLAPAVQKAFEIVLHLPNRRRINRTFTILMAIGAWIGFFGWLLLLTLTSAQIGAWCLAAAGVAAALLGRFAYKSNAYWDKESELANFLMDEIARTDDAFARAERGESLSDADLDRMLTFANTLSSKRKLAARSTNPD